MTIDNSAAPTDDSELVLSDFLAHFDIQQAAESMKTTPARVQRLWRKLRRDYAKKLVSPKAAREFVAETDILLGQIMQVLYTNLKGYNAGPDKLNAAASAAKQFKDLAAFRVSMRQDLGVLPSTRYPEPAEPLGSPADPKPDPTSPAEEPPAQELPQDDADEAQLEQDIRILTEELARRRAGRKNS